MKNLILRNYSTTYCLEIRAKKKLVWLASVITAIIFAGIIYLWLSTPAYVTPTAPLSEDFEPTNIVYKYGFPAKKTERGLRWIENEDGFFGPLDTRREYIEGEASWYSRDGCLGCSPTLTMANGQPLDDEAYTIACNAYELGTEVLVQNVREDGSGRYVKARITDTGGFTAPEYNRVADLTKAVRDAIDCWNCKVRIFPI